MIRKLLLTIAFCFLVSPAFAFPDNGVLETFTGTDDTTPPNANWTNTVLETGNVNIDLEDNAATTDLTGTPGSAYWNVTTPGPSCEAYATIVEIANTIVHGVFCRAVNLGSGTTDAYAVYAVDAASQVKLVVINNGVASDLGAAFSQTITTTDKFGIKTVGDQICAWFSDSGGAWTQLGCRTDSTFSAGGRIGILVHGVTTVGGLDDFGGGTVLAGARRPPVVFQ